MSGAREGSRIESPNTGNVMTQGLFPEFDPVADGLVSGSKPSPRIHEKYAPAFEHYSETQRAAAVLYFFPHASAREFPEPTRPRVVKWYCPFADQRLFPSGHRYSINVYVGCEHGCVYCYANGYLAASEPQAKNGFRRLLLKDLDDLERFDVPVAPAHLSNSTDALQAVESERGDTLFALRQLVERRHRFSSITLLTKNPAKLLENDYLETLRRLNALKRSHPLYDFFREHGAPPLRLECSLAFYRDEARRCFDPCAPPVRNRMEAIRKLRENGIAVAVRIDPLFPRDPLPGGPRLAEFGLSDFQSFSDLEGLVGFCRDAGVWRIIYSVAKITKPREGALPETMRRLKRVYEHLAGTNRLEFRGGSWRLPEKVAAAHVVEALRTLCRSHAMPLFACRQNLLETR